ncbi:MAG TPA: tetratricopeptide repeat protein, partial [Nitrospirota bacterium]|nr:tetratricopeptide repeat protein [Nitrospirota bacterium]
EDALQTLEDILQKDEGNLRALTKIRDIHQRMGSFEKAEEAQQRVLKLNLPVKEREEEHRRLIGLKYEMGRVNLEEGNLEKAKRTFKTIMKMDKDFVPAHLGLGEVYLEEGENAQAAELWEEAYKATGSIIFLHRLEDLYLKLGTPGRIINLYKAALVRAPKDANLNFFLGKLYYRLEMVDEAFETLSAIDASTRQFTDLHKLLGNLYLRRGSSQMAVDEFKRALAYSDQLIVPYRCGNCEHFSTEWSGRCPRCGKWNSFNIDLDKYC